VVTACKGAGADGGNPNAGSEPLQGAPVSTLISKIAMKKIPLPFLLLGLCHGVAATDLESTAPWRPDHTVIVVLENLSAQEATGPQRQEGKAPVYDNPAWSFVNELARRGARFTQAYFGQTPYGSGLPTRPSQPNYLFLFSGHHQGVLPAWFADGRSPYPGTAMRDGQGQPLPEPRPGTVGVANSVVPSAWLPLTSPNLGASILATGGSFASFSESLPYPSWNCATDSPLAPCDSVNAPSDDYRRKHNPAINWTDQFRPGGERGRRGDPDRHVLPVAVNLGFEPTRDPVLHRAFRGFSKDAQGRPLSFDKLPSVSVVIPNEQHDAHSSSAAAADKWLRKAMGAYAEWALTHNSLLIVTFDEDGSTDASHGDPYQAGAHPIPTIFFGAKVKPGVYGQRIDHLNVLSTVLWLHGALDRFKADFRRQYGVAEGAVGEAEREYRNLKPVVGVWQPGGQ
jgi:hypothetical protein